VMDVQECTIARTDFVDIDEEREWQLANAQLIADAPLLLAEVKQLQKRNEWLEKVVAQAQEHYHIDLRDEGWPRWEEEK